MENTQVEKINSSNRLKKTLSMCILGLFLFLILILVYEYFRIVPENVRFTNVTSTSVTVSWNTKSPISATAVYKKGDGGFINLFGIGKQVFYDTRDLVKAELKAVEQTSKNIAKSDDISVSMSEVKTEVKVTDKGKYYTHHVEIRGLDPETEYSFFVGDDLLYRAIKDVDGNTTVKTAKIAESVKTPVPAYSSVKDAQNKEEIKYSDLTPVNDGVVYVNYFDDLTGTASNQFSAVLNDDGNWYVDLSTAVDSDGNLFFEKYDTDAKNLKIIITVNAGPLGIWRQWQNAYTIAPAQETVLNMTNGVTDESMEGAVVKLSQNVNGVVKGIMAKEEECECKCSTNTDGTPNYRCPTGYDFNCNEGWSCATMNSVCTKYDSCTTDYCGTESGPTCYKEVTRIPQCPSCTPTCPSGFDWECPSGKECTTIKSSCTPQYNGKPCGPKKEGNTCYKVKETPPQQTCKGKIVSPYASKSSCIYYLSFSCSAPCYYVDGCDSGGDPHYIKCASTFCDNTGIPGLDCRKEPPQEDLKCENTNIKVGTYGYVNDKCKLCEWTVINNYGGYGLKLIDAEDINCSPDPKCGWNSGKSFANSTVLTSNLCSSGTPSPTTVRVIGGSYSWKCTQGTKEVSCSATVSSETPDQPQPEVPDACQEGTVNYDTTISAPVVCNGKEYVKLNGLCTKNGKTGYWNDKGDCYVASKDPELQEDPISEVSPEHYCWTKSGQFYFYDEATGDLYKCVNNILTGPLRNDESDLAKSCEAFATSQGSINSCDSGFLNLAEAFYCSYGGVYYYCKDSKWQNVNDINEEEDIIAGGIATISVGEECTGVNIPGGNVACRCTGNVIGDYSGTYSNRIINVGKWCLETPPAQCADTSLKNEGKVCDDSYASMKMVCKNGQCMATEYESDIPQINVKDRQPCANTACRCLDGPDDGRLIGRGQFCREISGSCGNYDVNLNKICNNSGNTCSSSGYCEGNKDLTYHNSYKIIKAGERCFYSSEEINNEIYGDDLEVDYGSCKCSDGPDSGKVVNVGKFCRNTASCRDLQDSYNTCIGEKNDEDDCIERVTNQVCNNDGKTCTFPTYECLGAVKSQLINKIPNSKEISFINKSVIDFKNFKVSAQTKTVNSQFIIDQQTGMFVNLPQGEYIFEYEGQQYYFEVTDPYGNKRVFIDKGLDGKYDEGTDILVSDLASIVQIEPIELRYTYVLKQGFNFVSFPFLVSNQEYRTAAGLLKKLNDVYKDTIYSIAKYDGSWKVVGQNEQLYSSNDFQLLPGQGYVIKAKDDVTIDIWGKPIKYDNDSPNAPVTLFKGWNLVGLYGSGIKQYTAKTLLEDINKYEKVDFNADNVSKWDSELQRYAGFQVSDKNGVPTEYGFDYPIYLLNSYFIRVQNGEGNWQPELAQ